MQKDIIKTLINEEVSQLPSVSANDAKGKYDLIQEITKEINDTKCHLADLEMRLRHAMEEYNAAVAMGLRKRLPQLSINLDNGRCTASYYSTTLSCWPDINQGTWKFEPNRSGRAFIRRNGHLLPLTNQVEPLVDAIVDYFSRYRTLNVQ